MTKMAYKLAGCWEPRLVQGNNVDDADDNDNDDVDDDVVVFYLLILRF